MLVADDAAEQSSVKDDCDDKIKFMTAADKRAVQGAEGPM
jgi:hypothetical protein